MVLSAIHSDLPEGQVQVAVLQLHGGGGQDADGKGPGGMAGKGCPPYCCCLGCEPDHGAWVGPEKP
jgi:hypothetical protein